MPWDARCMPSFCTTRCPVAAAGWGCAARYRFPELLDVQYKYICLFQNSVHTIFQDLSLHIYGSKAKKTCTNKNYSQSKNTLYLSSKATWRWMLTFHPLVNTRVRCPVSIVERITVEITYATLEFSCKPCQRICIVFWRNATCKYQMNECCRLFCSYRKLLNIYAERRKKHIYIRQIPFLALCCACGESSGWHQKQQKLSIMLYKSVGRITQELLRENKQQELSSMLQISWMNHPRTCCQEHPELYQTCRKW